MSIEGKIVAVTGAGQGIGKCIAEHLLKNGAAVAILEQDVEAGKEAAEEYAKLGPVCFIETDTSEESSVQHGLNSVVEVFGGLDGLVNNAAIADPYNGPIEELSLERWRRIVDVNLTGYFLCTKYSVPHLRRRSGAVVNLASTRALQSEPHTEAYSATKGGVVALTHALANSLGPDIRVNCISPGWISVEEWKKSSVRSQPDLRPEDHAQHPVGRVGVPHDVASMTRFLLSEEAAFVTGQNFVIDGGMTRKMIYRP